MYPTRFAAFIILSVAFLSFVFGQTVPSYLFKATASSSSPVIESVSPEGDPIRPFLSDGDLWLNTWADDDNVYSGWGDGLGVALHTNRTDCGIARFTGSFPSITATEQCIDAPTALPGVNDKPSSLLYFNSRLYGLFHSPLGDAWIGYLAYSDDYGKTWTRVGFYQEGEILPSNASPWTRDKNSKFRCAFFINMGKSYSLNTDGYVYALGIGREWSWLGETYLMRVKKEDILKYAAWEYLSAFLNEQPRWSSSQSDAIPLANIVALGQGSAMYHPGIKRYLFLTSDFLFDAPNPWGPWTLAGSWVDKNSPVQWLGGYQPGVVSKDTGPDSFWFSLAGQNASPMIMYRLHLGKMKMKLRVVDIRKESPLPTEIWLSQNYPNPFNPTTTIAYNIEKDEFVQLNVIDIFGRLVRTVVAAQQAQGRYQVQWDGKNDRLESVSSGMYLYRLKAGFSSVTRKMVLLK
jgi:hypothetical protein